MKEIYQKNIKKFANIKICRIFAALLRDNTGV
jgi:hypothetical protein